jgi:hypothetical protein
MSRKLLTVFFASLLVPVLALADSPLNGTYESMDIGGPINTGRYSESWSSGGDALSTGVVLNAADWDGATLGGQWAYSCGVQLTAPVLLVDNVDVNGNGNRTYMKTFTGGSIRLSGSGPWGNGDAEYTGPISSYNEFETIQYVNHVRTHAVSNVSAIAFFDGYSDDCMQFSVGNGLEVGATDLGHPMNPDYPAFMDTACGTSRDQGAWWDLFNLQLYITGCEVSNEDRSWGEVKSFYR